MAPARQLNALGRHLALAGFMGSGKTTVGEEVARRLGRPFLDLDREVAAVRAQVRTLPSFDPEVVHLARILDALEAEPAAGPLGNQLAGYAACLEQQAQLEEALAAVAASRDEFRCAGDIGIRPVRASSTSAPPVAGASGSMRFNRSACT